MKIAVETLAAGECFHNIFEFECFYHSIESTEKMFSISFRKHCAKKNGKSPVYYTIKLQILLARQLVSVFLAVFLLRMAFSARFLVGCSTILSNFVIR